MDNIIRSTNFVHDNKSILEDFSNNLRIWINENEETCSAQQVTQAFEAMAQQLLGDVCPSYDTQGWKQADEAYNRLTSLADQLISDSRMDLRDLQELCHKQSLKFRQYGPATIHVKIMKTNFRGNRVKMSKYTKILRGDEIMQVVSSICKPIVKKEDTNNEKFYLFVRNEVDMVMEKDFDKAEFQKKEYMDKMIDFAVHLFLDYSNVPKEGFVNLNRLARSIMDYFKELWEQTENIPQLKSYLKRVEDCIQKPGFPPNSEVISSATDLNYRIRDKASGPGYVEKLGCDIIELLGHISKCKTENEELIFEFFRAVLCFYRDNNKKYIENQSVVFTTIAPPFKKILAVIDMKFLVKTYYVSDIMKILEKSFGKNKKYVKEWLELAVALFRRPCYSTMLTCRDVLAKDDIYKWKDHKEIADQLFEAITSMQIPKEDEQLEDFCKQLVSCLSYFMDGLKKSRIIKNYGEGMMYLSLNMLELKEPNLFDVAEDIAENIEINVKEKKGSVMEVMNRLHMLLKDEDLPWHTHWNLQRAIEDLLGSLFDSVEDGRIFTNDEMRLFVSMSVTCLNHDGINPEDNSLSAHFSIAVNIMNKSMLWLGTTKRLGLAVKLIPLLLKFYDEDDENLCILCARFFADFAKYEPATLFPYFDRLLRVYLDKDDKNILRPINLIYPVNPGPLKEHFQVLMSQFLERVERDVTYGLAELFSNASRKQPELFTDKNIQGLLNRVQNDAANQTTLIQILQELCKRKPETMVKYIDQLMIPNGSNSVLMNFANDMVCCLALNRKSVADKVLDFLLKTARNSQDESNIITALNSARQVGYKYPSIIKAKRQQIEQLNLVDPNTEGIRRSIIDMIEGKTPNDLKRELEERQQEFKELVNKVEEVEVAVVAMREDMDSQGEELKSVKTDVVEQKQRLDQVEETVDETVVKVEEIDSKTLSHAPYWSRDISKLLNPQAEHDWRLLSSRLGYSNDDIRGWAQQADPCMAMLNEWYATRKTSEATLAILTQLQEMDRLDVTVIVENAMKNAEAVVEDEEFEYASPPPIFISYQWGHQEEVKLLKKHLEMAGYECWMDIGQMGGGDKLFEKIDNGIRAAKVVISCISNKYTKSPNCNREVNLSVGLHKPLIPLLMEQCPWPPPGSMGPIFSESLFIRLFQRSGEETTDQRYWPEPKFLELLMQLNMNGVPPDEAKIEPEYKNWWMPIEQEIKIDKNRTRNGGQASQVAQADTGKEGEESPEVFISYQWGKQKNIIKLYQRLTGLGFNCWLDIKQMGGGDSLYDKIDRGIRGSKVVLSCVTQKYSLSANCRREVSLADALKKPLIPLLLEKMTWPPSGPMSMVMTQLLYIGFTEEEQQTAWQGPQFDELMSKIHRHIPPTVDSQGSIEANEQKTDDQKKANKKKDQQLGMPTESAQNIDKKAKKEDSKVQSDTPQRETEKETPSTSTQAPIKPKAIVKPIQSEPAASVQSPPPESSPPEEKKKSKTCSVI